MIDVMSRSWEEAARAAAAAEERYEKLRRKRRRLVDLLVDGVIERAEYLRKVAQIEPELLATKVAATDVQVEEVDLDGALSFAREVYTKPAKMWRTADLKGKRALQELFFPEGVTFDGRELRAAKSCLLVRLGEQIAKVQRIGSGIPTGIRTPVSRLRIWRPRPG